MSPTSATKFAAVTVPTPVLFSISSIPGIWHANSLIRLTFKLTPEGGMHAMEDKSIQCLRGTYFQRV